MIFTADDIASLDRIYRLNLINSLPGLKPVNLVGTISNDGVTNLAIISSVIHIGSDPPLLGFMMRPTHNTPRHTYSNIKETGQFSINMVTEEYVDRAHLTSGKFSGEVSEFDACGFTETYIAGFNAPMVKESPVKTILSLEEEVSLSSNNSVLIVGKIQCLMVADDILQKDGNFIVENFSPVSVSGLGSYFKPQKITELSHIGSRVNATQR